ncbi:MAG: secretion protein HlyD [Myxococcales bacterium]|nr:secretion protein HlyD [Myxococcales bacterium]
MPSDVDRYVRLGFLLAVVCACHHEAPPPPPGPMPVGIVAVEPTRVVDSTEYLATMRSHTAVALRPLVDGQVTTILVHSGETVEQGTVLMQIDPGRQPAAVSQARAARSSREATLRLAEKNLERVRYLVETGALPRQELDNAEAAVESARGDVKAIGAEIASNRVQLAYYRIVAPTHGVVGDIPVNVGDHVTQQTVLTSVTDNRVLEANISIPIDRMSEIKLGTEVHIVEEAGNDLGNGKIKFISPLVNADTQSVLAKANIENSAGKLRADQIVRVRVVWKVEDGLTVPALAVVRIGGQTFVYVAVTTNQGLIARQRPVVLGDLTNNVYVVKSGLRSGERIVTSGVQKLRDGAPIAPAKPAPQPQAHR